MVTVGPSLRLVFCGYFEEKQQAVYEDFAVFFRQDEQGSEFAQALGLPVPDQHPTAGPGKASLSAQPAGPCPCGSRSSCQKPPSPQPSRTCFPSQAAGPSLPWQKRPCGPVLGVGGYFCATLSTMQGSRQGQQGVLWNNKRRLRLRGLTLPVKGPPPAKSPLFVLCSP